MGRMGELTGGNLCWARPVGVGGGGRQHAGGLARSEGADLPRVVSVSQGGRV